MAESLPPAGETVLGLPAKAGFGPPMSKGSDTTQVSTAVIFMAGQRFLRALDRHAKHPSK
jgi:hypothetical protein